MADSKRQKLRELMEDFEQAMLVTRNQDGQLRSRPMSIAETTQFDTLLFVTSDDSAKVDEIEDRPRVNVAMQGDDTYLSISGRAKVLDDRDSFDRAWSPALRPWFPDGKDSDDIVVLEIEPEKGEYWNMRTRDKFAFLVEAGEAIIEGDPMRDGDYGQHSTVSL